MVRFRLLAAQGRHPGLVDIHVIYERASRGLAVVIQE